MDELDQKIVGLLAGDARMSLAMLARRLHIARSTVQARLERLETQGVIAGYTIKLGDAAEAGRLRATAMLEIDLRVQPAILQKLRSLPEVERIITCSGRIDLMLQLATRSTQQLDAVLDLIGEIPGVQNTESLIHLTTKLDRAI
ncbi:AsnC family transcriptional regulator [Thioclava dalianensis]|uniref:AsnC family transcriptional regulator n=1 Tax=Thioclava dalianensis TaxID=1185766 RepID=A0A074TCK3_9RHOB|nr:Lrp/AsnC family transcriptional regulator [Thioclava dalianensis]KEP69516.1 AsnC family transcriptional regulator [Thioclava dalianensis]SFN67410.1 DNA-binding transcriptional regulator, Lrp family [Thioclava dalianensis]